MKKDITWRVLFHSHHQNLGAKSIAYAMLLCSWWYPALSGTLASAQATEQTGPFEKHSQSSAPRGSVQSRPAAQNQLFREQWDDDMKSSPELATAYGDYRYNNLLSDYSLGASERKDLTDRDYRAKLAAIATEGFSGEDRLSHDLLLHVLDDRITDYGLRTYEMPISQMEGVHREFADLPNSVPLDTVQHYQDYVSRLHQIPRAFEQTIAVLRQGEKDGLMPPRALLNQIPAQCEDIIGDNPFLAPTKKFPSSIPLEEQKKIANKIAQIVQAEVLPAYRTLADFIAIDARGSARG